MAKITFIFNGSSIELFYNICNLKQDKTILFLHGWGSNKEVMQSAFKTKLDEYKLVFVDMPGFGKSKTNLVLTTTDYSKIINIFLDEINQKVDAIAGHSFGGKVATLMNPTNLILLSSAGIVEKKSPKTLLTIRMAKIFNKCGLSKVTKLLRSKDVNMMDENMYETFKNVVDEDFESEFSKFNNKAFIFWGEEDTSTTLSSGHKIHSLINNSKFHSYKGDHYFFLKHSADISSRIKNNI